VKKLYPSDEILIVDDDKDLCFILRHVLQNHGIVKITHTLQEAKDYLATTSPQVVLLDNNLPDGLGMDFISHIKDHNGSAKIIMMTAQNGKNMKEQALRRGAASFLNKPFTPSNIKSVIEKVI
jgi:DNA-binding response OmpR family regulator